MMSVTARARRCFELRLQDKCILLDFDAGQSCLLGYEPFVSASAFGTDVFCGKVGKRWLIKGEPQLEVPQIDGLELGAVDAVLITSAEAMLVLPFLTEYSHFRGVVYATSAAMQLGRQLMIELAMLPKLAKERLSTSACIANPASDPAPPPPRVASELWEVENHSRPPYTIHDVHACMRRIEAVSYGQLVQLGGSIQAVAFPCASLRHTTTPQLEQ